MQLVTPNTDRETTCSVMAAYGMSISHPSIPPAFRLCSQGSDHTEGLPVHRRDHGIEKSTNGTELHWQRFSHHNPILTFSSISQPLELKR